MFLSFQIRPNRALWAASILVHLAVIEDWNAVVFECDNHRGVMVSKLIIKLKFHSGCQWERVSRNQSCQDMKQQMT